MGNGLLGTLLVVRAGQEDFGSDIIGAMMSVYFAGYTLGALFLWPVGSEPEVIPFRAPATEDDRRYVKDIAIEELIGLARNLPGDIADDAAVERMARAIGITRITAGARERLERAWSLRSR